MSTQFGQLLEATIEYLHGLKAQGVRTVQVSPEILKALATPLNAKANAVRTVTPPAVAPPRQPLPQAMPRFEAPAQVHPVVSSVSHFAPHGSEARPAPPPSFPAQAISAATALSTEAKAQAMAALRERAIVCVKCPNLAATRKNVVFGVGNIHAQLMFVGEAPGADEDRQGEPFVGAAGQLLTKIIQAMGLKRESVYIANILKCRPDMPPQSFGNRKPTLDEMKTCIPFLHEQIDFIQPKVLVALGGTAVEGLLGKTIGITRLRGHWQTYRNIPLMPTFHPSFLLRSVQAMSDKRHVWEDMMQVMERLEMPISEKQRGYFLKG